MPLPKLTVALLSLLTVCAGDLLPPVGQTLDALSCLEVKLDPKPLTFGVNDAIGVGAITINVAATAR